MLKKEPSFDFEETYISYFYKMKSFAQEYVLSEDDAENIVQDIFLELWEKRETLSPVVNLIPFLFTSIKNRCIDHLRHKIIVKETASQLQEEYTLTLKMKFDSLEAFDPDILADPGIEQTITNAINSLPQKCREIFIKSKIEGKKQKEIASELNISVKTVENQMSLAYKKLKIMLKSLSLI